MSKTKIEWTGSTWNPVTGCTKISECCDNCYAERMSKRLRAMGQQNYVNGFDVACHPRMLDAPLKWKKSNTVFVNSMGDLFHEKVPLSFIEQVFGAKNIAEQPYFSSKSETKKPKLEWSGLLIFWIFLHTNTKKLHKSLFHVTRKGAWRSKSMIMPHYF